MPTYNANDRIGGLYRPLREAIGSTEVSRYYDTAGIKRKYLYIQTIDISSAEFDCLLVIGILKMHHHKQYFHTSDIAITRQL